MLANSVNKYGFFKTLRGLQAQLEMVKHHARIVSLRTMKIIERLNNEFIRRTKSMQILPGERSCHKLLTFIYLKMEMYWRSNSIGKVGKNLALFKMLEEKNLTQNSSQHPGFDVISHAKHASKSLLSISASRIS